MFRRFLRIKLGTLFTLSIYIFCAVALMISIRISMEKTGHGAKVQAGKAANVQRPAKAYAEPLHMNKASELDFYFNGKRYDGVHAYKSARTGLYLPLEWILQKTGIRYTVYPPDDIMETHIGGKRLLIRYGEGLMTYGGIPVSSKGVPIIYKDHILVPAGLFAYIEGFFPEESVREDTAFLNYYPGCEAVEDQSSREDGVTGKGTGSQKDTEGHRGMGSQEGGGSQEEAGSQKGTEEPKKVEGHRTVGDQEAEAYKPDKNPEKLPKLNFKCDYTVAITPEGPFILVSEDEDGIYYLTDRKGIKVGRYSRFPEGYAPGDAMTGGGTAGNHPSDGSQTESTAPGNVSGVCAQYITRSPDGKYVAAAQADRGLTSLKVVDTSTHTLREITFNYPADKRSGSFSTEWLSDTKILVRMDEQGWVADFLDDVHICRWTRE